MLWSKPRAFRPAVWLAFGWSSLALGCAGTTVASTPDAPTQPTQVDAALAPELLEQPPLEGDSAPLPASSHRRQVGDLLVHRFHGSYAKRPLILTERVVALEGDLLVVDYQLDDGKKLETFRVRLSARSERVIAVSRLHGESEKPAELAEYDAFLARTLFVPDQNRGAIERSPETCLVGPDELACQVAKYRVLVGDREATLTVRTNAQTGRDLSGEVVAVDGSIIYKAELIEQRYGAAPSSRDSAAALNDAR